MSGLVIEHCTEYCLRIINFASFNSHTNILFNNDKVLKFQDTIKLEQMKLIFQFKTNSLPPDLNNLFQVKKEINCHITRNATKDGLFIPQIRTKSFGTNSIKYAAPVLWNNHLKFDEKINTFPKITTFKKHLKNLPFILPF